MELLRQRNGRKEARDEERRSAVKRVGSLYALARTREQMADGGPPYIVNIERRVRGVEVEPLIPEIASAVCQATGLQFESASEAPQGHSGPVERGGIALTFTRPVQAALQAS